MYHRGQGDTITGVLVDCDPLPATGPQLSLRLRPSPNSKPYLAWDFTRDPTFKPKYYRHDLESFFYLLHRSSSDYRTTHNRKPGKNSHSLRFDNMPFTWYVEKFRSSIRPEFTGLTDIWLIPLWKMIGDAYFFHETHTHTDPSTLNGHLTYDTFMGVLCSIPSSERPAFL
ncbi:hypothetical protein BD779DRAFT_861596 [Infundibulicybe gibba]|nr:hypothetical protein BD779DRAFT_861596 [Infundibulicybe gibba]